MELQLQQCWAVYYLDNFPLSLKKNWFSVHVTKRAAEQIVNQHNVGSGPGRYSGKYYGVQEVVGTFINDGNTFLILGTTEDAIPVRHQNTLDS